MNVDLEYSWMRAMIEGHNVAQVERDLIEARDIIARDYPGAAFAAESVLVVGQQGVLPPTNWM